MAGPPLEYRLFLDASPTESRKCSIRGCPDYGRGDGGCPAAAAAVIFTRQGGLKRRSRVHYNGVPQRSFNSVRPPEAEERFDILRRSRLSGRRCIDGKYVPLRHRFQSVCQVFESLYVLVSKMTLSENEILKTLMQSRDRIAAAIWLVVRDTQAAEDIYQNVVLKAMTKETRFAAEGAVLSWAFISARREGIDWLRRRRKERSGLAPEIMDLLEQDWLAESAAGAGTRMEALRDCLEAMPERSRTLLQLRYFHGRSCGEVAQQLGVALNAIYKRLSRLHQGLRDCVEGRMEGAQAI